MSSTSSHWPDIPYLAWRETCSTLHLWTQIIGKIRLAQTPWLNHGWHVPLYVTARGLSTSAMPHGHLSFEIELDFRRHVLTIDVSDGRATQLTLQPYAVSEFYELIMATLNTLGLPVHINEHPCEIPDATAFSSDRIHATYDPEHAHRFWLALLQVDRVFKQFRTGFLGKASPVHFFWGSFDLAVTRFSGRRAPRYQGEVPGVSSSVMREAYSHEVSSAGFWPGDSRVDHACFYSYAYPPPANFKDARVQPTEAFYSEQLGEFLLPYEAVRTAKDPDAHLLQFLQSTYEAAATAGHWDRNELECDLGRPRVPRKT